MAAGGSATPQFESAAKPAHSRVPAVYRHREVFDIVYHEKMSIRVKRSIVRSCRRSPMRRTFGFGSVKVPEEERLVLA